MASKKPIQRPTKPPILDEDIPTHPPEHPDDEGELVADGPIKEAPPPQEMEPPGPILRSPNVEPVIPSGPPLDKEKVLTFIEEILDTLTFKRVGLMALLVIVGLIMFSLYENRGKIFGAVTAPTANVTDNLNPSAWELSPVSKEALVNLAKSTAVDVIIISDVDLKKNRRAVRYHFFEDTNLKLQPTAQQALALPLPVFDYDSKNTEQMVAILSNEFRCDPYKESVYFRHAPELAEKFPTICRMAIPPFVGNFVGFLTVGVGGDIGKSQLDQIRLEVSRIAVEIYLNDVSKKQPPKP